MVDVGDDPRSSVRSVFIQLCLHPIYAYRQNNDPAEWLGHGAQSNQIAAALGREIPTQGISPVKLSSPAATRNTNDRNESVEMGLNIAGLENILFFGFAMLRVDCET